MAYHERCTGRRKKEESSYNKRKRSPHNVSSVRILLITAKTLFNVVILPLHIPYPIKVSQHTYLLDIMPAFELRDAPKTVSTELNFHSL